MEDKLLEKITISKAEKISEKEYNILRQALWIYLTGWLEQSPSEKENFVKYNGINKETHEINILHRCLWYMVKNEKESFITIPYTLWDCMPSIFKEWPLITFLIIK